MVKAWDKRKMKDNRLVSCWDEFSNRADGLPSIPNEKTQKVPKDVLHYVSTEAKKGVWQTTIPMLKGLKEDGKGGLQTAEGSGETPDSFFADVHWNISRKVININDQGVEYESLVIDSVKEAHSQIHDWFADDKDYSCQMALLEGGDRYIVQDRYWENYKEKKTAQTKRVIHPNIAYVGMTAAITRNFASYNYDTDMNAIATAFNPLTSASKFNLAALDGVARYASRFIKPLRNMSAGGQKVEYIVLVSPMQATQLMLDQTWVDLMKGAEKRGPENRALSGILGVRHGCLVIEDMRSPIFVLDSGARGFQYVTPMEAGSKDPFYGFGKLARAEKAGTGLAGSMEIARILGQGAIGIPLVHDVKFETENRDFSFQKELCGTRAAGYNRLDFRGFDKSRNVVVENISSALYFTPTPAISY
jgi:hypothetical protein